MDSPPACDDTETASTGGMSALSLAEDFLLTYQGEGVNPGGVMGGLSAKSAVLGAFPAPGVDDTAKIEVLPFELLPDSVGPIEKVVDVFHLKQVPGLIPGKRIPFSNLTYSVFDY